MKSDIDEVALQGIEFWSNVCDEEMDLAIEASEVSWQMTAEKRRMPVVVFGNAEILVLNCVWKSSSSPEWNVGGEPVWAPCAAVVCPWWGVMNRSDATWCVSVTCSASRGRQRGVVVPSVAVSCQPGQRGLSPRAQLPFVSSACSYGRTGATVWNCL